jgi:hypothetical protein
MKAIRNIGMVLVSLWLMAIPFYLYEAYIVEKPKNNIRCERYMGERYIGEAFTYHSNCNDDVLIRCRGLGSL